MKAMYAVLICCLLLAGCGGGKSSNSNSEAEHLHKPTLDVSLDIAGRDVIVHVKTDMSISEEKFGQARKDGEGHIHMYLDDGEKISVKKDITEFTDLPAGAHRLKVSLHNNDHTPYDVTKTIEFEIQ